ncbi:hypothetical protein PIB30_043484 [Stylosanthes scabra]|uniref:Transposase (putative) gypsy type domain-containing protein n=1 Tax=Stylosanthes scabra TaxID=79078 RepID=A0ABU6ZEA1_9FABA|nr:hypothetical protein [Stylosanthes scabra]
MEENRKTNENGKPIVWVPVEDPYAWVKGEVREMVSRFSDAESVAELGDPKLWVREGVNIGLEFVPCNVEERVYHKAAGEYFFMYTTVFIDLGVRFPFFEFENGVLSQLKCAPTQIHPNAWAFMRGFEILMEYLGQEPLLEVFFSFFQAKGVRKEGLVTLNSCQGRTLFSLYKSSYKDFKRMFVKVRSCEEKFPFYIDECLLERFLLYWYSEPVQILGMKKIGKMGKREDFDVSTSGLKNFFKWKSEKELSTSNIVKMEQGVVVNQPLERKRPISVKRRRQEEEGASAKGKVVDLMGSWCCGKEFSLEEVKQFTKNQRKLHGYVGEEDLTSVWSEHYPLSVVAEEHFQSKTNFDLIESVDDVSRAQFMQRSMEREKKLQLVMEQVSSKEKELKELKDKVAGLKGEVQKLEKGKTDLETRLVEVYGQKKEAETSEEHHGYEMLIIGFEGAKSQAEFFYPKMDFGKLDPIKVVHNGALVDDDEVEAEGGGEHNSEA